MSPRSEAQWQEMREQSKEKILSAALELFAERGFHNTTIQQIAKKAEVAKGLIYRYFDSKEDLLEGILYQAFKEGDDFQEEANKLENPVDRLRSLIEAFFTYIGEQPHHSRLLTQLSLQLNQFPSITKLIVAKYHENIPYLETLMEDVGVPNPKVEASLLTAIMDGLGIRYLIMGEVMDMDLLKEELLKKYVEHP